MIISVPKKKHNSDDDVVENSMQKEYRAIMLQLMLQLKV
jgi:hypothetical protein